MTTYPSIAAVDLGSNSFHLVVAREVDGRLQLLHKEKQRVFLAAGLDEQFNLSEEAIERALHVLQQFAATLQDFDKHSVQVVATYTLRNCRNIRDFLARAKKVFPFKINVISGQEEARLIYQGVANHIHSEDNRLVIDIGGGSTELIIGKHLDHKLLTSRNIGCVTLSNGYFQDLKMTAKRFAKAEIKAEQNIEAISASYRKAGWQTCIGTSGTIKTLSAIAQELFAQDTLTLAVLEQIKQRLIEADSPHTLNLKALPEERYASIAGGLAILIGAFRQLNIDELTYCDNSLREGLLQEMAQNDEFDIRTRTISAVGDHYAVDKQHAEHICETLNQMVDMVRQNWALSEFDLQMLRWAARLHEVGLAINSSGIHKHSGYIVLNAQLPGFTQEQQQLLGTLIRFHRKKIKRTELSTMVEADLTHFARLLTLLRLAILVHQKRQIDQVAKFTLEAMDDSLLLTFEPDWLAQHSLFVADLQQEQAYWKTLNMTLMFPSVG
ncbi:phosphatase [Pseudoalteromonas ardens]|uniref:Phosphatase n=1 Tax=Pseudoalteromonas rubra TaxID=43658 RepID=A0A0L0EWN3_9GAMM|nr:phosphatase [Pseudoalteromonas sp. R96]KNC68842.1 phosphatase [Pseudoalteromonas rubra]MDK1311952.1 exopolyphosphatase [Pseudoalteromonas sp. R96]